MKYIIVITGTSSGFGALTARALALAGHTVYSTMLDTTGINAAKVKDNASFAAEHKVDLRTLELDVVSDESTTRAIKRIIAESGRIDVLIHNAGHMSFGPAEAFTPKQFAELYDINVLGTQRVNRAALPQLRKQRRGLVVWVSSSSVAGGTPPYLAPYFAAKAAMDAAAVVYARELARWGIETSIIVPGPYPTGTNHFTDAMLPDDTEVASEYDRGPYKSFGEFATKALAAIVPPETHPSLVADAIVKVVNAPFGERPFRVHVDPTHDGAEVTHVVMDRIRADFLHRVGLSDLLAPANLPQT